MIIKIHSQDDINFVLKINNNKYFDTTYDQIIDNYNNICLNVDQINGIKPQKELYNHIFYGEESFYKSNYPNKKILTMKEYKSLLIKYKFIHKLQKLNKNFLIFNY